MKKFLFLFFVTVILYSCNKKENCKNKYYDHFLIDKYLVEHDSCKTFDKYSFRQYYQNDTLKMEGYGQQDYKQGKWKYYKNNKVVAEGKYNFSSPIETWKYDKLGELEWTTLDNYKQGYKINYPINYFYNYEDTNQIAIYNDTIEKKIKTNIIISVGIVEENNDVWFTGQLNNLKNAKSIFNIKSKKLDLIGNNNFIEGYVIQYETTDQKSNQQLNVTETCYLKNNEVYIITSFVKIDSEYPYHTINNQITRSFQFVNYTKE